MSERPGDSQGKQRPAGDLEPELEAENGVFIASEQLEDQRCNDGLALGPEVCSEHRQLRDANVLIRVTEAPGFVDPLAVGIQQSGIDGHRRDV